MGKVPIRYAATTAALTVRPSPVLTPASMADVPVASFHLVEVPLRSSPVGVARIGLDRRDLSSVSGLQFVRVLGCGRDGRMANSFQPNRRAVFRRLGRRCVPRPLSRCSSRRAPVGRGERRVARAPAPDQRARLLVGGARARRSRSCRHDRGLGRAVRRPRRHADPGRDPAGRARCVPPREPGGVGFDRRRTRVEVRGRRRGGAGRAARHRCGLGQRGGGARRFDPVAGAREGDGRRGRPAVVRRIALRPGSNRPGRRGPGRVSIRLPVRRGSRSAAASA